TTGIQVNDQNTGGAVNVVGTTINTNGEVGTEVVTVSVNGVKVGTYTITVVNTAKHLTKVVQSKNAITASNNVESDLFGTDENGGAFVGYNQYGDKIAFTAGDYTVYSSNKNVIDNDLDITGNGTA